MDINTIIKLACLVIAIWFWVVIAGRWSRGHEVGGILLAIASIALVAFGYMQGWFA